MKTIRIRIVCDPFHKLISYLKFDENANDYVNLDETARITSKSFTNIYIDEKCSEILSELYNRYNADDSILSIDFIGNDKDFNVLKEIKDKDTKYFNFIELNKNEKAVYNEGQIVFDKITEKMKEMNLALDESVTNNIYQKCVNQMNVIKKVHDDENKKLENINEQILVIDNKKDSRLQYFKETVMSLKKKQSDYVNALKVDVNAAADKFINEYAPKKNEIEEKSNKIKTNTKESDEEFQNRIKNREDSKNRQSNEISDGVNDLKAVTKDPVKAITGLGKIVTNFALNVKDNVDGFFDDINENNKNRTANEKELLVFINDKYHTGLNILFNEEKEKAYDSLVRMEQELVDGIDDFTICEDETKNNQLIERISNYNFSNKEILLNVKNDYTDIEKVNIDDANGTIRMMKDKAKKDLENSANEVNKEIINEIEVWVSGYVTYIKKCFDGLAGDISAELEEYDKLLNQKSAYEKEINKLDNIKSAISYMMSKQVR